MGTLGELEGSRVPSVVALPVSELGELITHQLENLFTVVALEHDGAPVDPDSFTLSCSHAATHAATDRDEPPTSRGPRRSQPSSFQQVEPRLEMIGNFLSGLLRCATFEREGRAVAVNGFRLTSLERWARYECPSLFDNINLESVSSACSCDCDFCFLKGWGPVPLERRFCTLQEAQTRKKYYSVTDKRGLPRESCIPGEPFLNSQTLTFIRMAREIQPDRVFNLTTNGDFLDEETVRELARLKPLMLAVSLNAANDADRRRIMKSKRPAVGVEAIPLLQAYGLQYIGSIVASPAFGVESIAETARFLDRHEALMVRLLLPGYTRFQETPPGLDSFSWWDQIVGLADTLRLSLATPILLQPHLYEDREISPRIDGIYRNSPAERAGLRRGDVVLAIGGAPVFTKADVLDAFAGEDSPQCRTWQVTVRRGDDVLTADLVGTASVDDDLYPYKPKGYRLGDGAPDARCMGLHVPTGFRLESLVALKESLQRHPGVRQALLFTTPLLKAHLVQAMHLAGRIPECSLGDVEVRLTIAEHRYWGGNIVVGDLHVVQDYIDHLRMLGTHGYRPEVVLLPNSFLNQWNRDITGGSYHEIERRTGIPVELVKTKLIMW